MNPHSYPSDCRFYVKMTVFLLIRGNVSGKTEVSTKCLRGEDFATFKGHLGLEGRGGEGGGIGFAEVGLCQAPMSLVSAEEDKRRRPVFSPELERQAKLNQPTDPQKLSLCWRT